MQCGQKLKSVGIIVFLLLFCALLTAGAATRLEQPAFTQVQYEQNNDNKEHVVYFYVIHNAENRWGKPFQFCFPEQAAICCTLESVNQYEQYSVLMAQEQQKWDNGKRHFGRYCVELLKLQFEIPDDYVQDGPLELTQGKLYFSENYYQNMEIGQIIIHPAGTEIDSHSITPQQNAMSYISVGDFSERPYFSDFSQVWAYLRAS